MRRDFEPALKGAMCEEAFALRAAGSSLGWGSGSPTTMCCQPRTFRLAIGLFSEVQPLGHVLSDLAALGLAAPSFCLLGLEEALDQRRWNVNLGDPLARFRTLFDEVSRLQGLFEDIACVASAGSLLEDLCAPSASDHTGDMKRPGWLPDAQYQRLHNHVRDGGLVLIVSSGTPTQQDASCRILLRHSQHGVQTHDFTLPAAKGQG